MAQIDILKEILDYSLRKFSYELSVPTSIICSTMKDMPRQSLDAYRTKMNSTA